MGDSGNDRCSFCGNLASEVDRILMGPTVAICDACTMLAAEFAGENRPDWCDRLIARVTALRDEGR
jgi:ATP-dependent protease Clp ATPase subunit